MTISFIELDFHFDSVDGFCRIFEHTEHQLNIFIKPEIFERIKHQSYVKKYKWFFCQNMSRTKFLSEYIREINCADCIFINTIANEFGAYVKADFKRPTISRTHNAYKLLDPWNHLRIYATPLYFWKAFSYFVREIVWNGFWYYRPKLIRKIDYFIFPDDGITSFVLSKGLISPQKVLPSLSLKVYEPVNFSSPSPDQYFRITIIGSVDQRRRNYEPVVEAFQLLTPLLNRPVTLSLLGRSTGKYAGEVIQKLKRLESDNFKLESFTEVVPQDVFDAVMAKTQLILSPVNLKNSTEIFGEIYGQTKISGSLLDVLRFPKITILPAGYNLDGIFKNFFDQYGDSKELKNILLKFITQEHLVEEKTALIKKIIEGKFTASTLADQFVSTIKTLSLPK